MDSSPSVIKMVFKSYVRMIFSSMTVPLFLSTLALNTSYKIPFAAIVWWANPTVIDCVCSPLAFLSCLFHQCHKSALVMHLCSVHSMLHHIQIRLSEFSSTKDLVQFFCKIHCKVRAKPTTIVNLRGRHHRC